jgi:hypothetical protein
MQLRGMSLPEPAASAAGPLKISKPSEEPLKPDTGTIASGIVDTIESVDISRRSATCTVQHLQHAQVHKTISVESGGSPAPEAATSTAPAESFGHSTRPPSSEASKSESGTGSLGPLVSVQQPLRPVRPHLATGTVAVPVDKGPDGGLATPGVESGRLGLTEGGGLPAELKREALHANGENENRGISHAEKRRRKALACAQCGKKSQRGVVKLKKCSRCRAVTYCKNVHVLAR